MSSTARWLGRVFLYLPIAVCVNDLVVSVQPVYGSSMQPTLNPACEGSPPAPRSLFDDVVLVNRIPALTWSLKRGDVVVLRDPVS